MITIAMVHKMPNMKPHNSVAVAQSSSLDGLVLIWTGIIFVCVALLLSPSYTPRPTLNFDAVTKLTISERLILENSERQAFLKEPLSENVLSNIAVLALGDGDKILADRIFTMAAARNVRNFVTNSFVIDALLAKEQFSAALQRIDGLLRTQPLQSDRLFSTLGAVTRTDAGMIPLLDMLANTPPWRRNFFNYAGSDVTNPDVLYSIFIEMRAKKIPISDDEIRTYLKKLIDQKRIDRAYFVWLDLLNEKQLTKVKLLYDGEFDAQLKNLFFDWTIKNLSGVGVARVLRPGGRDDQALLVDLTMAKPNMNLVEQILLLPVGNYHLSGEVNSKSYRSKPELQWQMRCADKTSALAVLSSNVGYGGWAKLEADFTLPAQDCSHQKLVLRAVGSNLVSDTMSGQIYFDKLRIVRRP